MDCGFYRRFFGLRPSNRVIFTGELLASRIIIRVNFLGVLTKVAFVSAGSQILVQGPTHILLKFSLVAFIVELGRSQVHRPAEFIIDLPLSCAGPMDEVHDFSIATMLRYL